MKKIPWLPVCIGCAVLALLVAARCCTTAGRELYYGTAAAWDRVLRDPWFYVGIAAAAVSLTAGVVFLWEKKRKSQER